MRLCLSRRFERWRCDLFADQPAVDRRRQSSKKRRPRWRESLRQEKMRVAAAGRISFPVNSNVPAEARKLNSNKICAVRIHTCAVRWLNSYFGDRGHGVVAVVDYTLAAGIELDDFRERILTGRGTHRVVKRQRRIWRSSIANLRGSGRDRRSRVEGVGRRRGRCSRKSLQMHVVDLGKLTDLNQCCLVWRYV